MKDTDLRGIMLQQFYERRREGYIGLGATGVALLSIPAEVDPLDALRVCAQLGEHGLLEWSGSIDEDHAYGAGKITAAGVDVAEGERSSPISIHLDQSRHEQHVTVTGGTGVQVAGDNARQHQTVTHHVEQLIREIEASPATNEEKTEAKFKLGEFLKTKGAEALFGVGTAALLKMLGL
jgi:hypothetical protein